CVTADANAAAANNAYTSASSAFTTADTNHSGFVSGTLSAKEKALTSAKAASNYDTLAAAYNAAQTAVTTKKGEYDGMLKAYDAELEAYKTVRKTYEDASTSKTLEDLTKKLSECTIKSETNGVITAINAVVGSAMGQSANAGTGPLAVIQDTSNLVISTSFKEYDIPNIKIGQKVSIKSDATGDKVINGTVSQISLTANAGQNGANDVSFPAEIQVSDSDSGLLVGMNAKANVILSQKDNIFVVPADAIGTNEKGEQVVYVKNGEIFEPVVVTTGEKNDFYTEIISTKLSVGTIVRSNADEAAAGMMSGGGMAAGGDTSGMSVAVVG
ncbi:MAG: efflux RND transporter periplasmic adaptor subunit, partial [Oscillospiraceae bacterium]